MNFEADNDVALSNRAQLEWVSPGLSSLRKQTVNLACVFLFLSDRGRGPLDPKGDNGLVIGSIEGFQMRRRSLSLFRSWETTFTPCHEIPSFPGLGTISRVGTFVDNEYLSEYLSAVSDQKIVLLFTPLFISACLATTCQNRDNEFRLTTASVFQTDV